MVSAAQAAVPISLPDGEVLGAWRAAFEIADLTPAATRSAASVRIRLTGGQWEIVAIAPDGRERSEAVRPPQTPLEREEVALLAQSLVRDLGMADAPDPWRAVLPPPPPPPPAPPPPAPVRPEPEVVRARPVEVAPPPSTVVVVVPPRNPRSRARPALTVAEPTVVPALVLAPLPTSKRRRAVALPGVSFGPVLEFRPNLQVAAGFELGVHPGRWKRWSAEVTLRGLAGAGMKLGFIGNRQLVQYGARLLIGYHPWDRVELQAGPGVSVLQFRQQFYDVDAVFVPVVAVGTSIALIRWRGLSLEGRVHGTVELNQIDLYGEFGSHTTLSPLTGVVGLTLKTPTVGDPSRTLATFRK